MGLLTEQIEHLEHRLGGRGRSEGKSHSRRWMKNQMNRKIRRVKQTEIPNIGYKGWEY